MANEANSDEELLNSIDNSEFDSLDEFMGDDDIESIINSLANESDNLNSDDFNESDELNNDIDSSGGNAAENSDKKKKKGLFGKKKKEKEPKSKKSKKDKKAKSDKQKSKDSVNETAGGISDIESIDSDAILNETGSTSEDMENFDIDSANQLLNELDNLDKVTEAEDNAKEEKARKKKEKKEQKEKKKKEKKELKEKKKREKTPKEKKVKQPKPYIPEEKVHISAVGIAFILTIVIVVVFGVYLGAGYYSYNSNINKASSYYIDRDYEKAYATLAGMNIKKSDEGLYNQVLNIMKVKKHLNDFEAFMQAEKYSSALEALLRGIESYDENISASNELGTTETLNLVLNDISVTLQSYYGINIDEARNIIQRNASDRKAIINEKAGHITTVEMNHN